MPKERRREYEVMRSELLNERQTFMPIWRDIADYIAPYRSEFTITDNNKGKRKGLKIIDNTATLGSRTASSGIAGHVTSPSRQWVKLTVADPDLREVATVKAWLHTVTKRMLAVFQQSNAYNSLPVLYGDMLDFATGAMMVEEDFDNIIRTYVFPIGSYAVANNDSGIVNVFLREFRLTVRQLVMKFGERDENGVLSWKNFSHQVRSLYDKHQLDTWVQVMHIIRPNEKYNPKSLTSKKFESVYYERGISGRSYGLNSQNTDVYLRESGYDYFPVLVPRWSRTGEDVYGRNSPGFQALGDVKDLQLMHKRAAQAIEKQINPPMTAPSINKSTRLSILPGDISYTDEMAGQKGFRPAHEVNLQTSGLDNRIAATQQRINRAYYVDIFLMLALSDRREVTATEINEKKEEKFTVLGPVLEQLNLELLDPFVDITFSIMERRGLIPPPPPEIEGQKLKVDYISVLHQAQKLTGLVGIERLMRFANEIAQFDPAVIDKIDRDQAIDEVADITGVPPRIVVPDEVVLQVRQDRAQKQAQAQQMAMLQQAAGAAKDLGNTDLDKNSALAALAGS